MYSVESEEFDEEVLSMEAEMMQCNTVEEMMYCIPQCIPSLKCDAMYLVLDDHLNAYKKRRKEYSPGCSTFRRRFLCTRLSEADADDLCL